MNRRDVLRTGLFAAGSLAFSCEPTFAKSVVPAKVRSAQEAAELVLMMARQASAQGTFGVGGALIENRTGRVIHAMHNNVLRPIKTGAGARSAFVWDPTAHGERQLTAWYFENRKRLSLPAPSEITVVTSLDPCAMCAGSMLEAGFNVGVVAFDDYAGVNYTRKFDFPRVPAGLRQKLQTQFGYYAVAGERAYSGAPNVAFANGMISAETAAACAHVFDDSAGAIRTASQTSGRAPKDLTDLASIKGASPVRSALRAQYRDALSLRLADYRQPNSAVRDLLTKLRDATPRAKNAVAFFDPFGNLLLARADRFDISPIATAFMNVVQDYGKTRFALMSSAEAAQQAEATLTGPKYGTFVFLQAPTPGEATTLKDMGAYGSTMEGPVPVTRPSNFQFFDGPLTGTIEGLRAHIASLPPLYTELVGINPEQVTATR